MLIKYSKIGTNQSRERFWFESPALEHLGFAPSTFLRANLGPDGSLQIKRSEQQTRNKVSHRRISKRAVPIIDLARGNLLSDLGRYEEVRIKATFGNIAISPTRRAFHIRRHKEGRGPIPTFEAFCGGGTITEALHADPAFQLIGACEIEPRYAHCHAERFRNSPLIMADFRDVDPADFEPIAFLFGSLPCECFSSQGVTKNRLKGQNELGKTGDLFIPFLNFAAYHMPLAVMIENVPAFETSLAGQTVAAHLTKLGYHITTLQLKPHAEWNEIQDRRRFVLIATRDRLFTPEIPGKPFAGRAGDFLDPEDPDRDAADATRITRTIDALKIHNERHKAAGNGFGFTVINRESTKVPTLVRSYHKINCGPFVETPFGLRLLRQKEIERIMGCEVGTTHYATAVEVLGQGVQTRIFKSLFRQLAEFLEKTREKDSAPEKGQSVFAF